MCDPPLMPFRDAGYSQADFILNVQDVVYGVWRAKEKGLVNLREFVLDEYANSPQRARFECLLAYSVAKV